MSGPNYGGQGGYPQQTGGYPQQGGYPGQGGYPQQYGQQGQQYGPQGYPGGPGQGGYGPGGQPPQGGGQSGMPKWVFAVIGVLVVAIIGVMLWLFAFKDGEPTASGSPSATTSATETASSETPSGDQSTELGGGASSEGDGNDNLMPEGSLPEEVGDWRLKHTFGIQYYAKANDSQATISIISIVPLGTSSMDLMRGILKEIQEVGDGSFCGKTSPEKSYQCYIHPGKLPDRSMSLAGRNVPEQEMQEVAKAIVAHK